MPEPASVDPMALFLKYLRMHYLNKSKSSWWVLQERNNSLWNAELSLRSHKIQWQSTSSAILNIEPRIAERSQSIISFNHLHGKQDSRKTMTFSVVFVMILVGFVRTKNTQGQSITETRWTCFIQAYYPIRNKMKPYFLSSFSLSIRPPKFHIGRLMVPFLWSKANLLCCWNGSVSWVVSWYAKGLAR